MFTTLRGFKGIQGKDKIALATMKAYLMESGIRVFSPKDAIKGAFQNGLIPEDLKWLEMIETRNLTTYINNEDMAEKVYA